MLIRDERPGDEEAIRQLVEAAFRDHPHSDQREHFLIDSPSEHLVDCTNPVLELIGT